MWRCGNHQDPQPLPTLASHLYLKRNKHWALSPAVKWHGQGDLRSKTLGQSRRNEPGLKWEKTEGDSIKLTLRESDIVEWEILN